MSSIVWQSWPGITLKESQKLLKFFASKDTVIHFKSSRKYLVGQVGQGVVVFRNKDTAASLINSAEGDRHEVDLSHLFFNAGENQTTNGKSRDWKVLLRDADKTPEFLHLESSVVRRRYKVSHEHTLMKKYSEYLSSHILEEDAQTTRASEYTPKVAEFMTDLWQRKKAEMKFVEFTRSNKNNPTKAGTHPPSSVRQTVSDHTDESFASSSESTQDSNISSSTRSASITGSKTDIDSDIDLVWIHESESSVSDAKSSTA